MPNRILVVDDEPDLELLITQKFRSRIRAGEFQFEFAGNGAIAFEKLTADATFDIVFTDINMPVMDGLTLLNKIREQNFLPKAVVISAYGDLGNIRTAMNRGAFDFVTKPIDMNDLEATLIKAIGEMEILKKGIEAQVNLERTQREKEKLILQQNEMLELKVEERTRELLDEKKKSDELLLNILPAETAEELKATGTAKANSYASVTVMFTDFKGFTQISEQLTPEQLVAEIDCCFSAFDQIIQKYGLEKIKTLGDSYMCAGGLPAVTDTHANDMVSAAIEIRDFMMKHKAEKEANAEPPFEIRIGINTGPVVAGIVGIKKFAYDIWGDTVNIASRMESSGETGKINISGTTHELIKDKFNCSYRGKISAKNKGEIDMYFVELK